MSAFGFGLQSEQQFPNLRVLAADDNRTNLHILSVFLKKLGHECILAADGEEALARFHERRPDLVLLDIMMPRLDGYEVARRIKAQSQDHWVPIIFLSALNSDENLLEGLEAGGDDYLIKPVNFVVLEAKMRSMQRSLLMQQRAIESMKRMHAVSDSVLEAIVTIDAAGIIVDCNSSVEPLFGWTAAELIGRPFTVLMAESFRNQYASYLRDYVSGGPPKILGTTQELEGVRRDGSVFVAELGVNEVHLNNPRLFIGVARDITERKQIERQLRENAEQLQAYYDHNQAEQALAMTLMEKQLHRRGLRDSRLRYSVIPAEHFSGDIVAANRSNAGRLYVLLGDATGHGLPAAISAMPVLSLFYRMAGLDRPMSEMIAELNQQLRESVPIGRFVAVTLLCLDERARRGEIWVGGTPEALLIGASGAVEQTFRSTQLPLGIIDNAGLSAQPESFSWAPDSQILLYSDGLLESHGRGNIAFAEDGILAAIENRSPGERFDALLGAFRAHLDGHSAVDDVSIILIDCP